MPEPYSRDVLHERTGEVISFPSNTPDEEVDRVFRSARMDAQAQNGYIQPLGQVLLEGARQYAQPSESTLPSIGGGAMVGLTPQQAQNTLQMQQQSNQDAMRTKIQREHMMQQSMEQEANRATELKLQKQSLKNRMDERKLMEDTAKFQAEQEGITKTIEAEEKTRQAEIKAQGDFHNVPAGTDAFNPYTGEVIRGREKSYAPQAPPQPDQETRSMVDPETGELTDYRITYDPMNGMVMSQTALGKSAPRSSQPQADPIKRTAESLVQQKMRADEAVAKDATDMGEEYTRRPVQDIIREANIEARMINGQPAFENDAQADDFYEAERLKNLRSGMQLEEAEWAAQRRAMDYMGVNYYLSPTGQPIVIQPTQQQQDTNEGY